MTEKTNAEKILQAEKEIRREGAKAAFLHGFVESTVFFIVVYFVLFTVQPDAIPDLIPIEPAGVGIPGNVVVAAALSLVFLAVDSALVYRRRTLEYFEQVNPQINEALRTARDAAERGEETEMAEALYEDVLEELKTTSSDGFVSIPRMAGSVLLVFAIAFLLLSASLGGFGGGGGLFSDTTNQGSNSAGGEGAGGGGGGSGNAEGEVQSSEDVLGETGEVTRGTDEQNIELDRSGSGGEGGGGGTGSVDEGRDYTEGVSVEGQRTEFSPEEEIEDAELVKEYNLRVRSDE